MKIRLVRTVAVALGFLALTAGAAQAQAPALSAPIVDGANVTFNWTASPGATNYVLDAGVAPGVYIFSAAVGNVTTVSHAAPAVGAYYVRVRAQTAGGELISNEAIAVVTSLVAPPAPPTNLQVFRNGTSVIITWAPGAGGGPVAGYRLRAGLTPGGSQVGVLPTAAAGYAAGGVPPNTYYLGVSAVNAGGPSAEATEAVLVMPANGACDAPPTPSLTTTAWGSYLTATWSAIPGASRFFLSASGPGFTGQVPFPGNQTTFLYPGLPIGTWAFGIQAEFSCGALGGVGQSVLSVDGASLKMEPRAPDPAPGTALAAPAYLGSVVNQIAAAYPFDLQNSCREHGGNNQWLFKLVRALRERDKRWGLNWKRANVGDMSQDVVTFNWSDEPDEGTFRLRAWDVIGNHCGRGSAGAQATEITNPPPPQLTFGARWTLIPYIQAGYTP